MPTIGAILNPPFQQQPGIGQGRSHLEAQAWLASLPPADYQQEQPSLDPLLAEAERLKLARLDQRDKDYFTTFIPQIVRGELNSDEVAFGLDKYGKTPQELQADVNLYRQRIELQRVLTTEPAERERLAELQRETERQRKEVAKYERELVAAQAVLAIARSTAAEAERVEFLQQQRLAELSSKARGLADLKFSQFSTHDEVALRERIASLEGEQLQTSISEAQELRDRERELENRHSLFARRQVELKRCEPSTGSNSHAIGRDDMYEMQAKWTAELSQLQTSISEAERLLAEHRRTAPAKIEAAERRREEIEKQLRQAREELSQLLISS